MQIEKQQTITYRWWSDDIEKISSECSNNLEEHAVGRIYEMLQQGYTSGDLSMEYELDSKEIEFSGWWEITTKTL